MHTVEDRQTIRDSASECVDRFGDKRAVHRTTLLLRTAKLIGPSGEFVCIVRDVSESGAKLRLFHAVADDEGIALEIATGERLVVEKVWERNGEVGFRFVEPIDVTRFVAEAGLFPKRPIRIGLNHPATLSHAATKAAVTILDISREGAKIETAQRLAIGQTFRLESDRVPLIESAVRWRRHPFYGLVFRQLMSMEELALLVYRIQLMK